MKCFFCREYLGGNKNGYTTQHKWKVAHHSCIVNQDGYYGQVYESMKKEFRNRILATRIVNTLIRSDFPSVQIELDENFAEHTRSYDHPIHPDTKKVIVNFQ